MVLPHRNGDMYACIASKKGVVEFVGSKAIRVLYEDGTKQIVEIGAVMGKWSGKTIPHRIETPLKTGDKVSPGDVISYNRLFYKLDPFFPRQLALTIGCIGYFTLQDRRETYEDGSITTAAFSKRMRTSSAHVRCVIVDSDLEIRNLLPVGSHVSADSILCTLHPRQSGSSDMFDERALATLQRVNSLNPKADYEGLIEKYRVLYTGEFEYMTDTLRTVVEKADDQLAAERKQLQQPAVDGLVEPGFRAGKHVLGPNQVMLEVYITHETDYAAGDKKVLGLQMKSVTGRVLRNKFETEDGRPLDGAFGGDSLERRIVDSPIRTATATTLSVEFSVQFASIYRNAGG